MFQDIKREDESKRRNEMLAGVVALGVLKLCHFLCNVDSAGFCDTRSQVALRG